MALKKVPSWIDFSKPNFGDLCALIRFQMAIKNPPWRFNYSWLFLAGVIIIILVVCLGEDSSVSAAVSPRSSGSSEKGGLGFIISVTEHENYACWWLSSQSNWGNLAKPPCRQNGYTCVEPPYESMCFQANPWWLLLPISLFASLR